MFQVPRPRPRLDDDIINVTSAKGEVAQLCVHPALEVKESVLQAERNDEPLPQFSIGPPECSLAHIILLQWHLVMPVAQVQLAGNSRPPYLIKNVFNSRLGVAVEVGFQVESM